MLDALQVVTTVLVGLMVGVESAVAFVMNPVLGSLPEDAEQQARSKGGRMLGALMPFWYVGSLALAAAWAVAAGNALVVTSAGLLVLSVVMSLLLLVPINNRGKRWTPETRPADWKEQLSRWDRYHCVRVAVIVAAFALLVTALV
ncbi:anthrone oxygenase family protein [Streptomyces sp. NPDC088745]|uniref:anthrone oxygenase family protein n=1 Tax=Streptomyces sp. NPDC088745 TaxID=3365884 RepID=UPI003809819B